MADFTSVAGITGNIRSAEEILTLIRQVYILCKRVEGILGRYQTEPAFKTEADHIFTGAQLAELNNVISGLVNLRHDLENNHAGLVAGAVINLP